MRAILSGTAAAMITPFHADGSIDFDGLEAMIEHLIVSGIDYLVALGTTAETPTMSFAERKKVLETTVECVRERVPIVVGIGCNNPLEVNEQIHFFDLKKISAILSVAPYYNRPSQKGLICHYQAIASQSPLPILLYNVPSRTGVNIEAETTLFLAKNEKKIIGIKEAGGNFAQIMQLINKRPSDFLVISGDDAITLPLLACGIDGVISVVANAYPKRMSQMVKKAIDGDFVAARELHYQLLEVMRACFAEGSPAGVKCFLSQQKRIEEHLRLPLVQVSETCKQTIAQLSKTVLDQ